MWAFTAKVTIASSRLFAPADRPTRPLYFKQACSAMICSRFSGHRGNRSLIRFANCFTYSSSSSARRSRARSFRRSLTSLSARHSASACASAFSSTNKPCRSYRPRALLNFNTTADSVECFFARLVNAASPVGRKTNSSRSAQDKHTAPLFSSNVIHACLPKSSPHSSHFDSRCEINTLIADSLGRCLSVRIFPPVMIVFARPLRLSDCEGSTVTNQLTSTLKEMTY